MFCNKILIIIHILIVYTSNFAKKKVCEIESSEELLEKTLKLQAEINYFATQITEYFKTYIKNKKNLNHLKNLILESEANYDKKVGNSSMLDKRLIKINDVVKKRCRYEVIQEFQEANMEQFSYTKQANKVFDDCYTKLSEMKKNITEIKQNMNKLMSL
ncbi:hypothetical protein COBT_001110 [Conglomerata obtusa]